MTIDAQTGFDQIRRWVLENGNNVDATTLDDTTALFEQRHITSIQVPELLLLIESVRRRPIDLSVLRPGDLRDLRTIYTRFLQGASNDAT
jgi:hypothetical protein